MTAADRIAVHRRRLDRMILVWPGLAIAVTAAGIGADRWDGRPFAWSVLAPGALVAIWGGLIYAGCRLSLRTARRLLPSEEAP